MFQCSVNWTSNLQFVYFLCFRDKTLIPPVAPYIGGSLTGPAGDIDVLQMSRSPVSELKGNLSVILVLLFVFQPDVSIRDVTP